MHKSIVRCGARAAALSGLLATTSFANVLVVDASGGGSYTQIQAAVDAAVDGDTVLVESGSYLSFVVSAKSVSIVGDTGSDVHVVGAIRVRDLAAGQTLVLENLKAAGAAGDSISVYGLYLKSNLGHIRVEACDFVGGASFTTGFDAIRIESSSDVALTRTTSRGGSGSKGSAPGNNLSGAGLCPAISKRLRLCRTQIAPQWRPMR
jgi:hypothetical protein